MQFTREQVIEMRNQGYTTPPASHSQAKQPIGEVVAWRWMPSQVFPQWIYSDDPARVAEAKRFMGEGGVQALTLATPKPEPIVDEALWEMWVDSPSDVLAFARRIEAHHGITQKEQGK